MTRQTATQTQQQTPTTSLLSRGSILQRKCESCGQHTIAGGECTDCAKKKSGLQRKLAIGASHDPLEREADRVADQVMAASAHPAVSEAPPCLQRYTGQMTEDSDTAPDSVDRVLSSPGRSLEPPLRQDMERRFCYDFSRVRIHTGTAAEQSARDVNANAYTVGHKVVFGAGQYSPRTNEGQHLLAHELAHVIQQDKGGFRLQRDEIGEPSRQRQQTPLSGSVTGVRISCQDSRIVFDTGGGSYSYQMTFCDIPVGNYTVGVTVRGTSVHFDFGVAASSERFRFGFRIEPGQVNPVTLFRGQSQVGISVTERLPSLQILPPTSGSASLASRVLAFQQLVKNAGKVRLAENGRALEEWRQFLQQHLTPTQVQTQVHAEEVRVLLESASRRGELSLAEQWLQTSGANRRWVLEQQIEGRYRACTGCHATVQADEMDRDRAEQGYRSRTPLEQLPAVGTDQGPRPTFAAGEQAAFSPARVFPVVAQAQERINALQPYIRTLGPDGYRVLPSETLGSSASPSELMTEISLRISQRQADYREFSRRIDAPDFDYLHLLPIVRDLLPLADENVRQAVLQAINSAQAWETIESIVVGVASIGLLLLAIFPPTSAIGIGGALALGTTLGAHQAYRGYQNFEQGRLYSLGRGADNVLDPAQQEAADTLMVIGALNIVLGTVGMASGALSGVRLIRSLPPSGGGLGALEAVEGRAGGNLYRVTGWGTRDPKVVVTGPNGQVIREGPFSPFRASASGGSRVSTSGTSGTARGYVYPTEGGAARVAQPISLPETVPTPTVVPQPATAPILPTRSPTAPDVRVPLATMGSTSALGIIVASSATGRQPVMPSGLPRPDQDLWRICNEQHNTYKATQDAAAAFASQMDPLELLLQNNQGSAQQRLDFCGLLDERIKLVQRLQRERSRYISLDCDRFDWFNTGTTAAQRLAQHQIELKNVGNQLGNFYRLRARFCR